MTKTENTIRLVGYLGNEPVFKTANNGSKMVRIRMATDVFYFKRPEIPPLKKTAWHNIIVWDRLAEMIPDSLTTGSHIMIEGELRYRTYINKQGTRCNTTEIKASKVIDLDR